MFVSDNAKIPKMYQTGHFAHNKQPCRWIGIRMNGDSRSGLDLAAGRPRSGPTTWFRSDQYNQFRAGRYFPIQVRNLGHSSCKLLPDIQDGSEKDCPSPAQSACFSRLNSPKPSRVICLLLKQGLRQSNNLSRFSNIARGELMMQYMQMHQEAACV